MTVHLMFPDRDFESKEKPCFGQDDLVKDLELDRILSEMSGKDRVIRESCTSALLYPLQSIREIRWRQENMRDALENPAAVRKLYDITVEAEERRKHSWCWLSPKNAMRRNFSDAVELLRLYTEMLARLRAVADREKDGFHAEGFLALLNMLQKELSDDYLHRIRAQLEELKCGEGMLISFQLGPDLRTTDYVLRRKNQKGFKRRWKFAPSFTLPPRDDAGARDLTGREERAVPEATGALAQSAEHLRSFFSRLRKELAFYVGGIRLAESLRARSLSVCIPELLAPASRDRSWQGLYDVALALTKKEAVTGNDLQTEHKSLYIITGANQGGKSTFLRSIGQSQLMAQCGLFVGAESFTTPLRRGIYTHFTREEDASMKNGKLAEELCRMDAIADHLGRDDLMLFNESFASTNEREGSEIGHGITEALVENGVEVFSVTHLYTFAVSFIGKNDVEFLRARRREDGRRSYRIERGEPLKTAFGEDLYQKIFKEDS